MDSQKILIDIASVSERVTRTLVRHVGRTIVEIHQLDKIVVGSNAVLETLNKGLLLNDNSINDRLADWLGGDEPRMCLYTLNQMERILNGQAPHGGWNLFQASSSTHTRDISNEAIGLFQTQKAFFHFLLIPTDICLRNRGNNSQQSLVPAQHSMMDVPQQANDNRDLAHTVTTPCKGGDLSGTQTQGGGVRKEMVNVEKLEGIVEWLNAWNCEETHRQIIHLRQPGTCAWLPNTRTFMTWKSSADSEFLWLYGKAGAGKSVLAASVIEILRNTLKDEILIFFYCDFRNERSTNAAEVMRSLLSQLLQHLKWYTVDCKDMIDRLVQARDDGTSAITDAMLLAHHFSYVVEELGQQPLIVIDALDECQDVEGLLDTLMELRKGGLRFFVTSRPLQVIKERLGAFPAISMDAMKYEISTDIELHVMKFLDSHRRLRSVDTNLKRKVYSALWRGADGMFRWVQCQLDVIKRCITTADIRKALNNLPSGLDETYERILLQIDRDREGEVVRRALVWLVAASVPLQLSQIMEGLSIDIGRQVMDPESTPVHGPALLDALGSLVTYDELTDVVTLSHFSVKEYLTGEPIHRGYPAYNINEQEAHTQLALLCICYIITYVKHDLGNSDGYGASTGDVRWPGICYDDYDTAAARTIRRPTASVQSSVSYSLLEYVLFHGFRHLSRVDPRNQTILQAIIDLRSHAQQHSLEWENLFHKAPYGLLPSLEHDLVTYILIAFAPEPLLRSYLDHLKPKLKDGTNPLVYAAYFSKSEHARTLLSRGVSLNHTGRGVRSLRQLLPLEVALRRKDCAILDLFLKAGSPVPQALFVSALQGGKIYSFPGSNIVKLLQTDEFVEWAVDICDEEVLPPALDPALYYFRLSEGDISLVQRRLIQIGWDPNAQLDKESLRIAVLAGRISTVKKMLSLSVPLPHDILLDASRGCNSNTAMIRFLLGKGSSVHVMSPDGDTLLHVILKSPLPEGGCLESVQMLVDAGCNPSACNPDGQTPLHLATQDGYISVIKYLLSLPVELPPDIMLSAAESGDPSTLRLLMSKGAHSHVIRADGDTPLHLVLDGSLEDLEECLECVKILINANCDPSLPNAFGMTPFDLAVKSAPPKVIQYFLSLKIRSPPSTFMSVCGNSSRKMSPMIQLLISQGIDIHSTLPNGDGPLHLCMVYSEVECLRRVETLVNAGCNPRVRNLAGETPFHVAARRGHIPVMEYLLSIGISAPLDIILTLLREPPQGIRRVSTLVRFLLDKDVDLHIVGEHDMTLLHFAAALYKEEDALEVVKLLIHFECNPSALNSAQETPLHIAIQHGQVSIVDHLLSLGVALPSDVLLATPKDWSHRARMIRYLVDKGADTSVATADGNTPLHLLPVRGEETDCLESCKILIDAGCDIRARNLAEETPLHIAARRGFVTILEYFSSQGIPLPRTILPTSAPTTICFLFNQGMVAIEDEEFIHRALDFESSLDFDEKDYLECTRILVDLGWDPSTRNSSGETLIYVAIRRGHISVVEYLLSRSVPLPADILLVAVTLLTGDAWRAYNVIQPALFLISKGASVNRTAPNGDTPLHIAFRYKFALESGHYMWKDFWELVKILLTHGAKPTTQNRDGQTPIDLAEVQGLYVKKNLMRLVQNPRAQR